MRIRAEPRTKLAQECYEQLATIKTLLNYQYEEIKIMFNEMNYVSTVREGVDTDAMEFAPLKDFCGQVVKVDGFFFTDGTYGKQVVVVGNGYKINMPKRAVAVFEEIAKDNKKLSAVLTGHLKLTGIKMKDTKNGTTAIYTLADC